MKSNFLFILTSALTCCDGLIQPVMIKLNNITGNEAPNVTLNKININTIGIDENILTSTINVLSALSCDPIINPRNVPVDTFITVATKAKNILVLSPYQTLAHKSLPNLSVPNKYRCPVVVSLNPGSMFVFDVGFIAHSSLNVKGTIIAIINTITNKNNPIRAALFFLNACFKSFQTVDISKDTSVSCFDGSNFSLLNKSLLLLIFNSF
jgi:hypothetical protein